MSTDEGAARRSTKLTAALRGIEDYVSEVVTSNHGMKHEEMVSIVNQNVQRSVLANAEYHEDLSKAYDKDNELASANYHKAMSDVYLRY